MKSDLSLGFRERAITGISQLENLMPNAFRHRKTHDKAPTGELTCPIAAKARERANSSPKPVKRYEHLTGYDS